jgi:hypothetical protein
MFHEKTLLPYFLNSGGLAKSMISLTREQIDSALGKLRKPVETYSWLQRRLHLVNVSEDRDFQRRFAGYYRVRFLKPVPRQKLFDLLEELKNVPADYGSILEKLSATTGRMEESFASKVAATIDSTLPVIDSWVRDNLCLSRASSTENAKEIHQKICEQYAEFLSTETGEYLIKRFAQAYPETHITHVKMLDFVLWQTR